MKSYKFKVGDHARYQVYSKTKCVIEITERWRDYMPGNEVMTPFYNGKDVSTGKTETYWEENLRSVNAMEVIAWASQK
jgi:hypothetical protein